MDFYQYEETNLLRRIVNWAVDIVVVIALAWFTVYCFGQQIHVTGNSMNPGMKTGDVVLMNHIVYDFGRPERYDVIAFIREDGKYNIKRVIGLPGETVQIMNGRIYIDGEPLDGKEDIGEVSLAGTAAEPVHLSDDEYFLLGDNRESSEDSRFPNIGNIRRDHIIGKVWFKVWPLLEASVIK